MITQMKSAMTSSKSRLVVLIDQEIKDSFEFLCELENRSMSNQSETLIKNFVEQGKREGKLVDRTYKKPA